jgi:hypothetical protein
MDLKKLQKEQKDFKIQPNQLYRRLHHSEPNGTNK